MGFCFEESHKHSHKLFKADACPPSKLMQMRRHRRVKSKSPMFSPMNDMLYQTSAFCSALIASRKARWKHENTWERKKIAGNLMKWNLEIQISETKLKMDWNFDDDSGVGFRHKFWGFKGLKLDNNAIFEMKIKVARVQFPTKAKFIEVFFNSDVLFSGFHQFLLFKMSCFP